MAPQALNAEQQPPADVEAREDAETRATRRELKQSSISDGPVSPTRSSPGANDDQDQQNPTNPNESIEQPDDDISRTRLASPKKKRAHDQLDGEKASQDTELDTPSSQENERDRAQRTVPEKKRHRDEDSSAPTSSAVAPESSTNSKSTEEQSSSSKFAASSFGGLASAASPFASLGGKQTSAFGAAPATKLKTFASLPSDTPQHTPTSASAASSSGPPTAAPKLTFGSASGASPFAGLGENKANGSAGGFGRGFGGASSGFGSGLGSSKLSSFAAPGSTSLPIGKPAKAFGAPDSDNEEDEEDEDDTQDSQSHADADPAAADDSETVRPEKEVEEKKRVRLQKVEVDAGESGEATVLSVRAKMFYHDKDAAGWKERGAGMLKINVPERCIDYDGNGIPVPGSFDASSLDTEESAEAGSQSKVVRLLMRQDHTHRVLLNTVVLPAMTFQDKASLKSVAILFTAFEGPDSKPVSVTMRMSAADAKNFTNEVRIIQRELQGN